jgi:hypothetical protein
MQDMHVLCCISVKCYRLRMAPRSLAVLWLQDGNAAPAAAMADLVSAAFMQATLAMISSVAGLFTCRRKCHQQGVEAKQKYSLIADGLLLPVL